MGSRGIQPPYSSYISPEDIIVRDKLTQYNDKLLELMMWEATPGAVADANQIACQVQLAAIYASMSSEEQGQADTNRVKLMRGERQVDGTSVGSE